MIQFIGVHLGAESATVAVLGRDLRISARSAARMLNASKDAAGRVTEVPPAEWVRAGCYAIQEAYFQLPVKKRKPWGVGLSGPSGWIALNIDYQPLSAVRLTSGVSVLDDLASWIEQNPSLANQLNLLLSPKDYFRFAISSGLATDATEASRLKLLLNTKTQWSSQCVQERGLTLSVLPPVFDSCARTGRLSEEGMRQSCLPGGTWLIAGSHEVEAALVAGGDVRTPTMWILQDRQGARRTYALGVAETPQSPAAAPQGWERIRSPVAGHSILEQARSPEAGCPAGLGAGTPGAEAAGCRNALEGAGLPVSTVASCLGAPEEGAALLAAIGSGLLKSWDPYYEALAQAPEALLGAAGVRTESEP